MKQKQATPSFSAVEQNAIKLRLIRNKLGTFFSRTAFFFLLKFTGIGQAASKKKKRQAIAKVSLFLEAKTPKSIEKSLSFIYIWGRFC